MGGKIALQLLHDHPNSNPAGRAAPLPPIHKADAVPSRHPAAAPACIKTRVVLLDAMPGVWNQSDGDTDPDSIMRILDFLSATPLPIPSRKHLWEDLHAKGFTKNAGECVTCAC